MEQEPLPASLFAAPRCQRQFGSALYGGSDIEEFLADPAVFNFIADRFYVAPLPDSADLPGSIVRARDGDAWRLASVLEEIGAAQEEIARCRRSWDELPLELFGGQPDKEAMAFELVQAGAFRAVVAASASERLDVLTHLLNQSSLRHLKGSDKVLPEWILQFAQQGQPLRVEEPLRTDNQTQTVFISYANEDAAKAAELTNHLRAKGICVFEDRVRKRPTHVIVLLSNDWLKSGEVRDEFDLAWRCGAAILPVVLESNWGVTVGSEVPLSEKSPVVWAASARVEAIAAQVHEFIPSPEKDSS